MLALPEANKSAAVSVMRVRSPDSSTDTCPLAICGASSSRSPLVGTPCVAGAGSNDSRPMRARLALTGPEAVPSFESK